MSHDEAPRERHIRVARRARYYTLGAAPSDARELWVACHGYGQLAAGFAKALAPLATPRRLIVAPEGLSRFYLGELERHTPYSPIGASWMTREDREHEIADYVEYLDTLAAAALEEIGSAVPVHALGFSQGVATVARWAVFGRTALAGVILWGGSLPKDLPFDRGAALFRDARVRFVAGRKDGVVPLATIQGDRGHLTGIGVDSQMHIHERGHLLSSATLREIGELVERQ